MMNALHCAKGFSILKQATSVIQQDIELPDHGQWHRASQPDTQPQQGNT